EAEIPNASNPTFSPDGRWIVYQVDSMPNRGRPRGPTPGGTTTARTPPAAPTGLPPVPPPTPPAGTTRAAAAPAAPIRRMDLRELATGRTQGWQDMQSATFSATSTHLLLRRRAAGAQGARPGGGGGGPGGPGGGPDGTAAAT